MINKLAEDIDVGRLEGIGALGLEGTDPGWSGIIFNNFISMAIGTMTVVAIIWFIIQFFLGAIGIITAGGDKNKLQGSQQKITTSVIGLVVTVAAVFLISVIGGILGIENILNPGVLILRIREIVGVQYD